MIFLFIFFLLFSKVTIGIPLNQLKLDIDKKIREPDFNGTLTEEYLYALGYTNQSETILLNFKNVTSIAPFAFSNFIKLRNLTMSYNSLKEITPTAFRGLQSLVILDLHCNLIMKVANNSFIDLNSLTSLFLGCNEIYEVNSNTFNGLTNLTRLDLSFNGFKNIEPLLFSKLSQLESISLFYNRLLMMNSSEYFVYNQKLKYIKLTFNWMTYLDKNIFKNLTSVIGISLQGNRFRTIDSDIIQGCTNIKYFCLQSDYFFSNFTLNMEGLDNLEVDKILNQNCDSFVG